MLQPLTRVRARLRPASRRCACQQQPIVGLGTLRGSESRHSLPRRTCPSAARSALDAPHRAWPLERGRALRQAGPRVARHLAPSPPHFVSLQLCWLNRQHRSEGRSPSPDSGTSRFVGNATAGERWLQLPSRRSPRRVVPPAFSALGHDLKRPRLEVVKDLLQPRDVPLDHVLYGASVAGHNRSSSADTYKSALT